MVQDSITEHRACRCGTADGKMQTEDEIMC
jgi:hypothetical protein